MNYQQHPRAKRKHEKTGKKERKEKGRYGTDSPLEPLREYIPADILIWGF